MFLRTKNIKLSPIKQMELLAAKIPDVVSLAQGIPSFDTPDVVKKAAIKALNRGVVAKYSLTYGLPELRETIEQKLAESEMYYDFEKEIIATAGSIEAITASLISIINSKKDEVILFSPSYASYCEAIKVAAGRPIFVNLIEADGWRIDFKNLARRINNRTAAIIICNPNNPTGTIFPKEDLLKIAELAWKRKIFIICDEVYKNFIYDNEVTFFSLAQIPQLRKIVIRVFSLSKIYAMTGWRIGFLHSDEENVSEIVKVHDSLVTCSPVISQYAAISALDFADKEIEEFRQKYQERRDLICRHLDDLPEFFSYQKPQGAYFIFPKIIQYKEVRPPMEVEPPKIKSASWRFAIDLLKKARVAVVPGLAFGPSGEGHIRMSFGRSEKDINEAMRRIKEYFNE
ncbi:aminotransferase [Candidatus Wolfebacteria bacterium CG18_big_fil_WC_8_21_14_2_50_39_7]|uniref:Aminotransferase n=4 Tax=Candidatus Wolfeibacteriota TaxID=1752735 RepID=A0A2M7Q826_9BACT|nr:pyridoxal phosphate-dependent aminotransferase [Parcubacteria group bacterium]NCO89587.1 pyridoxal phosphate-dependent aminotransferase [Candidatus Wolfebacteria bacterium]OIO64552.1 MAG: hypothetical protein AUJ30_02220 [Candidatus Wolfebacteria bacterium CG1_02_39_135]PIP92038.1 MAG: aminotransferase [Candidatus Wolfebacteria bacterium CG18_big_fil_WC_8_21_14_2_50_39_7]PIY59215.1 MAG: aminotransferase [Candidatus Wolfebacteria bacterium CG_4_10_14_0_8_um_filter_39_64]PJB83542.1 MAG: amino